MKFRATLAAAALSLLSFPALAETAWPNQRDADFIIRDFHFADGESLPELRLHYITLGTPKRDGTMSLPVEVGAPAPIYATRLGALYQGDCLEVLPFVGDGSVD